jgi:hypothetical protein
MRLSRIRSKTNYHRCIRDLVTGGYLTYVPSYHPSKGSAVSFVDSGETVVNQLEIGFNNN